MFQLIISGSLCFLVFWGKGYVYSRTRVIEVFSQVALPTLESIHPSIHPYIHRGRGDVDAKLEGLGKLAESGDAAQDVGGTVGLTSYTPRSLT